MAEFFEMGGYGHYVWPAYGVSFLVLAGLAAGIWRRSRALRHKLSRHEEARQPPPENQP